LKKFLKIDGKVIENFFSKKAANFMYQKLRKEDTKYKTNRKKLIWRKKKRALNHRIKIIKNYI